MSVVVHFTITVDVSGAVSNGVSVLLTYAGSYSGTNPATTSGGTCQFTNLVSSNFPATVTLTLDGYSFSYTSGASSGSGNSATCSSAGNYTINFTSAALPPKYYIALQNNQNSTPADNPDDWLEIPQPVLSDGLTSMRNYCQANGIFISVHMDEQRPAKEWLQDICDLSSTVPVWNGQTLDFYPLSEVAIAGGGVVYTPGTANGPLTTIDDKWFIVSGAEAPVKIVQQNNQSVYNQVEVIFSDKHGSDSGWVGTSKYSYNQNNVTICDQQHAFTYGTMIGSPLSYDDYIVDANTATLVGWPVMKRQRFMDPYHFTCSLPVNFSLFDPMDLVTLQEPYLLGGASVVPGPFPSVSTPNPVRQKYTATANSVSTFSFTIPFPVIQGNQLVFAVELAGSSSGNPTSISDNLGNDYTDALISSQSGGASSHQFIVYNVFVQYSGLCTVSLTLPGTRNILVQGLELTGIGPIQETSPVNAGGFGTTWSSQAITVTQNSLLVAFDVAYGPPAAPTDTFADLLSGTVTGGSPSPVQLDTAVLQVAPGTYTSSWEQVGSSEWLTVLVGFPSATYTMGGQGVADVRIYSMSEGKNGVWDFEFERFLFGCHAPQAPSVTYASPPTPPSTNLGAGSVNTPYFFQPTPEIATVLGMPQTFPLALAVSGSADNYGGCAINVSTDGGSSYQLIGRVTGNPNMGYTTTSDYPSSSSPDTVDSLYVDLTISGGTLESWTAAQQAALIPLAIVSGGASPLTYEVISYGIVNMTGANMYTLLPPILRGQQCTASADHPVGSTFLDLSTNTSVFRYTIPNMSLIGTTLYFKFQTFNQYATALQDLSDCTAYAYTVQTPTTCGAVDVKAQLVSNSYTVDVNGTPAGDGTGIDVNGRQI